MQITRYTHGDSFVKNLCGVIKQLKFLNILIFMPINKETVEFLIKFIPQKDSLSTDFQSHFKMYIYIEDVRQMNQSVKLDSIA